MTQGLLEGSPGDAGAGRGAPRAEGAEVADACSAATLATGLDRLPLQRRARVVDVDADAAGAERARQLREIGFVPGEPVTVVARAWPGGDPLVVCIGASRFALRRAEAACVRVQAQP